MKIRYYIESFFILYFMIIIRICSFKNGKLLVICEVFFMIAYYIGALNVFTDVMSALLILLLGVNLTKYLDMVNTPKGINSLAILVNSTHFKIKRWLTNLW